MNAIEILKELYFTAISNPFARQYYNKKTGEQKYCPVRREITLKDLSSHLNGYITLGAYLVNKAGTCRFFVVDIDLAKGLNLKDNLNVLKEQTKLYVNRFSHYNIPVYVSLSANRGMHITGYLVEPMPAAVIKRVVEGIITEVDLIDGKIISTPEVFPKQIKIENVGSLVKVPLGIHKKTSNRALFVDPKTDFSSVAEGKIIGQLRWL